MRKKEATIKTETTQVRIGKKITEIIKILVKENNSARTTTEKAAATIE
jgi:hypothetical protein